MCRQNLRTLSRPGQKMWSALIVHLTQSRVTWEERQTWWVVYIRFACGHVSVRFSSLLFDGGRHSPVWAVPLHKLDPKLRKSEESRLEPARVCMCTFSTRSWIRLAARIPALTSPKWWAVTWSYKPNKPFPPLSWSYVTLEREVKLERRRKWSRSCICTRLCDL